MILNRDHCERPAVLSVCTMSHLGETFFVCQIRLVTAHRSAVGTGSVVTDALLRELVDNIPANVAYIDCEQRYQYCNRAYLNTYGIDPGRLVGLHLVELLGAEGYETMRPHVERVLNGESTHFERPVHTRHQLHYVEGHYVPHRAPDGQVAGFFIVVWDITSRRAREAQLHARATIDPLTGTLNRQTLQDKLQEIIDNHMTTQQALALLYLDLDRFKQINDDYGHAVGDRLLVTFCQRLRNTLRGSDLIWRVGGDEFVICLNHLHHSGDATKIASIILHAMQEPIPLADDPDVPPLQATVSIGIAWLDGSAADNTELEFAAKGLITSNYLVGEADIALYEAKRGGRCRHALRPVKIVSVPDALPAPACRMEPAVSEHENLQDFGVS